MCSPFIPIVLNSENHLISENVVSAREQQKIEAIKEHAHSIAKTSSVQSTGNSSNNDMDREKKDENRQASLP